MPRVCEPCRHEQRAAIDRELVLGKSYRTVADRFGPSKTALLRHRAHIVEALTKAREVAQVANADTLLGKIQGLEADARRIGKKAEDTADLPTALRGVHELVRIVELLARVRGELKEGSTVNVSVTPAAASDDPLGFLTDAEVEELDAAEKMAKRLRAKARERHAIEEKQSQSNPNERK